MTGERQETVAERGNTGAARPHGSVIQPLASETEGGAVRLRPFHYRLLLLAGLGQVASASEIGLLSLALPALAGPWGLGPGDLALAMAGNALGSLAGALLAGDLADRFGRKLVLQLSLVLMGLGAGLSALAPGLAALAAAQLFVGFGMGCVPPSMNTLLTEFAPPAVRGRLLSLLQPLWVVGLLLAALLGNLAVPLLGPSGAFLAGLLPLLGVPLLWRWLPEPPRSLLARGKRREAAALQRELELRHGLRLEHLGPDSRANRGRTVELLAPGLLRRTLCMAALWFTLVASYTGFLFWLPTLLTASTGSLERAYGVVTAINAAQLGPVFVVVILIDRLGRKWTVVPALALCGVCALLLGRVDDAGPIILVGTAFAATNLAGWAVMAGYTPEVFPTRLRARGVGLSSGAGRVAGLLTPLIIGALLAAGGTRETVFTFVGGLLFVGALLILWLGEETRGRPLEEIAA